MDQPNSSFARSFGRVVGLISRELGAAAGVIGGLCAGYSSIGSAGRSPASSWAFYLVGGGLCVAVAFVCRWRGRV